MPTFRWPAALVPLTLLTTLGQTPPPATTEPSWGELQRLRAENAALKIRVQQLETQLAAATQPATELGAPKEIVRTFTTMQAILANTPAALQPAPTADWHKFTEPKFLDWWRQQLIGMKFDQELPCAGASTSRSVVNAKPWLLTISLANKQFTDFSTSNLWTVVIPHQYVDDATAQKWDKVKPGRLLKISGTISNASITPRHFGNGLPSYQITLTLDDLHLPDP